MIAPRRTLIALSCALLLFGAAGCGVKAKDGSPGSGTVPVSTPDSVAPSTTAQPDEPTTEPDDTTTEPDEPTTTVPTTDGGGGNASSKVKDYCAAVQDYVDKVKAAMSDPTGASAGALVGEGEELSAKAQALATSGLSAADAQEVSRCTQEATSALTGG